MLSFPNFVTMSANPSPVPRPTSPPSGDVELLERLGRARRDILQQVAHRIVGQHDVLDGILTAVFSGGHALLVGVPGLAKTLMVQTVAAALDLAFSRIQFTPDLMPSDISGTDVMEEDPVTGRRSFRFVRGPVFANIVLADEINRTPPKTQAALLQAMQEHQVTAGGITHPLPAPFFVLATQNPIEQEGTYPLPEAQLDRFMFELRVGYPTSEEEEAIVLSTTGDSTEPVRPVLTADDVLAMQHLVRRIPVPDALVRSAVTLARRSRPQEPDAPDFVREYLSWGAGPRASQYLVLGAKARAALAGRPMPDYDDLRAVVPTVLTHRIVINFAAEAAGRGASFTVSRASPPGGTTTVRSTVGISSSSPATTSADVSAAFCRRRTDSSSMSRCHEAIDAAGSRSCSTYWWSQTAGSRALAPNSRSMTSGSRAAQSNAGGRAGASGEPPYGRAGSMPTPPSSDARVIHGVGQRCATATTGTKADRDSGRERFQPLRDHTAATRRAQHDVRRAVVTDQQHQLQQIAQRTALAADQHCDA